MKRPRRKFLRLAAGAAVLPVFSRGASAVDYPVRPVRIVVGFPAGGATDVIARLMGQWLSERLGQQFLIENRPGAGGSIAAEAVVKATPDGYTLLQVGTPNAINAALYSNLSFNFIRDIAPVGSIMRISYVIVVHPSVPATTVPEFIAYAKANAGRINMASAGEARPMRRLAHCCWRSNAILRSCGDCLRIRQRRMRSAGLSSNCSMRLNDQFRVCFVWTAEGPTEVEIVDYH